MRSQAGSANTFRPSGRSTMGRCSIVPPMLRRVDRQAHRRERVLEVTTKFALRVHTHVGAVAVGGLDPVAMEYKLTPIGTAGAYVQIGSHVSVVHDSQCMRTVEVPRRADGRTPPKRRTSPPPPTSGSTSRMRARCASQRLRRRCGPRKRRNAVPSADHAIGSEYPCQDGYADHDRHIQADKLR